MVVIKQEQSKENDMANSIISISDPLVGLNQDVEKAPKDYDRTKVSEYVISNESDDVLNSTICNPSVYPNSNKGDDVLNCTICNPLVGLNQDVEKAPKDYDRTKVSEYVISNEGDDVLNCTICNPLVGLNQDVEKAPKDYDRTKVSEYVISNKGDDVLNCTICNPLVALNKKLLEEKRKSQDEEIKKVKECIENKDYARAGIMLEIAKDRDIIVKSKEFHQAIKDNVVSYYKYEEDLDELENIKEFMNEQGLGEKEFKDIINSEDIINIFKSKIAKRIAYGRFVDNDVTFINIQGVNKEEIIKIMNSNTVLNACKGYIVEYLKPYYAHGKDLYSNISLNLSLMEDKLDSFIRCGVYEEEIKKIFNSEEVIKVIKECLIDVLSNEDVRGKADDYIKCLYKLINKQDMNDEEIKKLLKCKNVVKILEKDQIKDLNFHSSYDCKNKVVQDIKSECYVDSETYINKYGIDETGFIGIMNSEEVLDAYKDRVAEYIKSEYSDDAEKFLSFIKEQGVKEEGIIKIMNSEKVLDACKDELAEYIIYDDPKEFLSFMKENKVTESEIKAVINSNEVLTACKDSLAEYIKSECFDDAEELLSFIKEQGVNEEEFIKIMNSEKVLDACKNKLVENIKELVENIKYDLVKDIKYDDPKGFLSFMKENEVTEGEIKAVMNSNEVLTACKDSLAKYIESEWFDYAEEFLSFIKEQGVNEDRLKTLINNDEDFQSTLKELSFFKRRKAISFLKKQGLR